MVLLLSEVNATGSEQSLISLRDDIEYCREESARSRDLAAFFSAIPHQEINSRCDAVSKGMTQIETEKNLACKK